MIKILIVISFSVISIFAQAQLKGTTLPLIFGSYSETSAYSVRQAYYQDTIVRDTMRYYLTLVLRYNDGFLVKGMLEKLSKRSAFSFLLFFTNSSNTVIAEKRTYSGLRITECMISDLDAMAKDNVDFVFKMEGFSMKSERNISGTVLSSSGSSVSCLRSSFACRLASNPIMANRINNIVITPTSNNPSNTEFFVPSLTVDLATSRANLFSDWFYSANRASDFRLIQIELRDVLSTKKLFQIDLSKTEIIGFSALPLTSPNSTPMSRISLRPGPASFLAP